MKETENALDLGPKPWSCRAGRATSGGRRAPGVQCPAAAVPPGDCQKSPHWRLTTGTVPDTGGAHRLVLYAQVTLIPKLEHLTATVPTVVTAPLTDAASELPCGAAVLGSGGRGWGLRTCISDPFLGGADGAGPRTTLGEPLISVSRDQISFSG